MTDTTSEDDGAGAFVPSRDPETAAVSTANEPINVCRAAALSSMLASANNRLVGADRALYHRGFNEQLAIEGPSGRYDLFELFVALARRRRTRTEEARVAAWEQLNASSGPEDAYDLLIEVLGSPL